MRSIAWLVLPSGRRFYSYYCGHPWLTGSSRFSGPMGTPARTAILKTKIAIRTKIASLSRCDGEGKTLKRRRKSQ